MTSALGLATIALKTDDTIDESIRFLEDFNEM